MERPKVDVPKGTGVRLMSYPPGQYPPPGGPQYGQPPQNATIAIVGFAMAIGSVVLSFIPGLNILAFLTTPASLIVSIIANGQVKNSQGQLGGKGFAVAGIWISAIWMGLGLILALVAGIFAASIIRTMGLPIP